MPPPMMPAPRTAADSTLAAVFAIFLATFPTNWSPRKMVTRLKAVGVFAILANAAASIFSASSRPAAGALLHRGDRGDRRRVVGSGLPGDEALRGLRTPSSFPWG